MAYGRLSSELTTMERCPHCGVARPQMKRVWASDRPIARADREQSSMWAAFACSTCGSIVTAKGHPGQTNSDATIVAVFPDIQHVSDDLPERAKRYLQQAYETLAAPDAAAMVAGSAVDAMLKELQYTDGSIYSRIDKAVEDKVLTAKMGEWAHQVRLGSNRPRHADENAPHVSPDEARQSVEFADALGTFLFVLSARIERGLDATGDDTPAT